MTWQEFYATATSGTDGKVSLVSIMLLKPGALKEARGKWHPAIDLGHHTLWAIQETETNEKAAKAKAVVAIKRIQDRALEEARS